ncbi:CWF19-like protein 2 homolog [Pararge aegeria]|uniref:Jg25605 protein n=2 Tax=Pararge aegeria TaxID=116150 RepID=A0A8S4RBY4_9NEOP|nr:CWF19-like protein 2 homolog [Pararge aegeria]XP_039757057.1 CWF19-like protein 2 homolog [Pararge aegeria]XP_039757058.1 CWF19-like protein 2 homolog [Pararge aegeria]CAH2234044.1 jg25605 [Pararge aegeria aegeria]
MKEKRHKKKHKKRVKDKSSNDAKKKSRRESSSESSESSDSDKWVEKKPLKTSDRDEWMSMTGMLKTFTKDDIKSKEVKDKKHIDSYNPAASSRELNPYWKDGGSGVPQTSESFRKSRQFIKPSDNNDYYSRSSSSSRDINKTNATKIDSYYERKSSNWRKSSKETRQEPVEEQIKISSNPTLSGNADNIIKSFKGHGNEKNSLYLSDEKMNKLAAKIVKAEIMGNLKLVEELKTKLEAAREYRKNNPDAGNKLEEDDRVMLMSTTTTGNSRPLTSMPGDPRSKGGKRKAETHDASGRVKYFGNDDRYNLAQMFQEEKYGTNYDEDAELAHVASKSKNPNDDLEDIFLDNISKNKNPSKESEKEKQRAINQNVKLERSLEGCEHCFDSRNMLKHLIVSCGSKIYMALPAKRSLMRGHCILTTILHSTCVTNLDEDVWEEIMNYRKLITQYFNSQNKDVVFYETATKLHRFPHMVINCVPLPRDVGDMASIYFKKALLECEAEWSMNKKVVDLKGKNIRKGIPKGLPYFWIDFGMDPGFAHVIEDQQLFPINFAEEVIGGMLDLDHSLWKNPKKEYGDLQRKKVLEFIKDWKPFEQSSKEKK